MSNEQMTHDPLCTSVPSSSGVVYGINPSTGVNFQAAATLCICERLGKAYNRGWNDCTQMIADQQQARLSKKAQRTSKAAVARNADSIKGLQRLVLTAIARNPLGLTDFDLESALGRSHQSVSAARNTLMNAGLVTDSGKTRPNARGNRCIVWVVSSPSSKDDDVRTADPVPVPTHAPGYCGRSGCLICESDPNTEDQYEYFAFPRDIEDR
jgi:hypothetical protein